MFDILIRGGFLLDGTGAPGRAADVGISGDTIAAVGELSGASARVVLEPEAHASGVGRRPPPAAPHVCPGFIDAHSHSDAYLLIEPASPSKLYQGITTEVIGNCGASAAPIASLAGLPSDWAAHAYPRPWRGFAEYRARLEEARPAVNVVALVGHNTLRRNVIGPHVRPAADGEVESMRRLLAESLEAGARGFTTGLIYVPGMAAARAELVALAGEAGRRGGVYASHMRSEGDRLLESIEETIAVGREAGARVQISHLKTAGPANWGKIDAALDLIRAARADWPVAADRYPYTSGATELDVLLPAWAGEGGREATLARLADPALRARLRGELGEGRTPDYWEGVTIGSTYAPQSAAFRGMTVRAAAEAQGLDPAEVVLRLCAADRLRTGAFFAGMSAANMERILAEPWVMIGTDASLRAPAGPLSRDYPHPRAYGTVPRFVRLAMDRGIVALPEAVRKMTSLPAAQFALPDRGRIEPGMKADVVVFDPARIRDTATYADPHRLAEGIEHVIVNGVLTLTEGRLTGSRAGRLL